MCVDLAAPFLRNSATFAPDGENFYCEPYIVSCSAICTSPTGCTFGNVDFKSPVKYNLTSIGWDKYITSFSCYSN